MERVNQMSVQDVTAGLVELVICALQGSLGVSQEEQLGTWHVDLKIKRLQNTETFCEAYLKLQNLQNNSFH